MKSSIKWLIFIGLLAALFVIAACAPKEAGEEGEQGALAGQATKNPCSTEKVVSCAKSGGQITYVKTKAEGSRTVAVNQCTSSATTRLQLSCVPGNVKKIVSPRLKTCTYTCTTGNICSGGACVTNPCGNTQKESNEACDGLNFGNVNPNDLCAAKAGYTGIPTCAADCLSYSLDSCIQCGDGKKTGGETCDGLDVGGATCASVNGEGWTGTLVCNDNCDGFAAVGCNVPAAPPAEAPLAQFGCINQFNYDFTNTLQCSGDDQDLTSDQYISLVNVCSDTIKCEYKCLDGFQKSGNACVAITTAAGCTGGFPQVSTLCSGDGDQPLPVGITYSIVDTCTAAVKCERTCNAGYVRSGTNCVTPTPFVCTGAYAAATTLCSGDNNGLAADTAYTLVDTCTTAVGCERTCNAGYKKSGTSCKKTLGQTCTSGSQCLSGKCSAKKCTATSTTQGYTGDCGTGYFCNAGVNACELPSPGLAKYCGASYTCQDADGYGPLTAACQYQCPTGAEICDGCNNDGDTQTDEGCDDDNDDYCDSSMTMVGTPAVCPKGGGDCNDYFKNINPEGTEACFTSYDDDCNGVVNNGCAPYSCTDKDPTNDPTLPRNITLAAATGEVYDTGWQSGPSTTSLMSTTSLLDSCQAPGFLQDKVNETGCALASVSDLSQLSLLVSNTVTFCPAATTCHNSSVWALCS